MADATFKTCPACEYAWSRRRDFLADPTVCLVGYQVSWEELRLGLLMFNHVSCRGTLSIAAGEFRDLYEGPVFRERRSGQADCPGYCLHGGNLDPCPTACECAWVRTVIQIVRNWPKSAG